MKFYLIFTKKGLAVILALTVLALIIIGQFSSVNKGYADASTHQKRMEFLSYYKIAVNETPISVKETILPQEMSGNFKEYNRIIVKGGFNLTDFCGKSVTIYSYEIISSPEKTVDLILCDNKIIAGNITDKLKGEIAPIVKVK